MKQTKLIMGMPITIEIVGTVQASVYRRVFDYFKEVDKRFSTYKPDSEISKINRGLDSKKWSSQMREVLRLCDQTKKQTNGYFDINGPNGLDPSGLVKGWSINNAAKLLNKLGQHNFYIDAGGDVATSGHDDDSQPWSVGIRSPFNTEEIVKVLRLSNLGIATSGAYIRGQHIYNPHKPKEAPKGIASLTVVGPDIYEADRFATAAYAMGTAGIDFIARQDRLEAYMITEDNLATFTNGMKKYFSDV